MYDSKILALFDWIYRGIFYVSSNLKNLFLLWMRLTWGHQFILAGLKKISNIEGTTQFFASYNIWWPKFHAYFVGYTELIGGGLLILGLLSRLISIPLAIFMIVALGIVHGDALSGWRFITEPHTLVHEWPYPYLITCLLVFFFGPGRLSLDAWIKPKMEKLKY